MRPRRYGVEQSGTIGPPSNKKKAKQQQTIAAHAPHGFPPRTDSVAEHTLSLRPYLTKLASPCKAYIFFLLTRFWGQIETAGNSSLLTYFWVITVFIGRLKNLPNDMYAVNKK